MGWLKNRPHEDGRPQYTAVYRDLQGRERSAGTFTSKREATKAWQRAESELSAGRIGDPKSGRQRFRHYVENEWLPHHVIEASTREGYVFLLNRYILPEFGEMRMREILPGHVRAWVLAMQTAGARPPTIRNCKVILDAVLTTALNDQITVIHAGRGVRTPPVARKPKRIITAEQYEAIHRALPDDALRLLIETDIETGLRWGELTELRARDLDVTTGVITVSRAVVHLKARSRPDTLRFVVKNYPKDKEWRQVKVAAHLVTKLRAHIAAPGLDADDLLFQMPQPSESGRRRRPAVLPDPTTLGWTTPRNNGRQYRHGTLTAYQAARCRCRFCKDAVAAYRAERRAAGMDDPRARRIVASDGHISGDWFRATVWAKALETAELGFHVTPHGLRHAHASWLLAGGADLQVVKERLGHGSITTTEKYLHTLPGAGDAALEALTTFRTRQAVGDVEAGTAPAVKPSPTAMETELEEMREMVAKLSQMLGRVGGDT